MVDHTKPNWDDLRYFLHAVQAQTLAGAARNMGVEHSTVGRRLSALERALGAQLVIRGPDGLRLTPLGESVAPLVQQVERAVQAVHDQAMQQKTRVRLAMPTGFTKLFTERLERLRIDYPNLSLELLSEARPVDLQKGEADLAIRGNAAIDEDLIARKLGPAGWSLYAAPAYLARRDAAVDLNDLSGHDFIGYDPSLAEMPPARWITQHAGGAAIVLSCREMTDMLAAAQSGTGLAVLPCFMADSEPGLVRLTPQVLASRELALVYRREAKQAEPVRAVIRFVMQVMQDNAHQIAGKLR
jgi:DNA-binding transcriptional LysR family regulator